MSRLRAVCSPFSGGYRPLRISTPKPEASTWRCIPSVTIPQQLLEQVRKDICGLYGLQKLELTATHPESELQRIEPEELMWLFVSRNSMARGSLAGATWEWNEQNLTVKLAANGKETLLEHIPSVEKVLRERFAAPVHITVEAGNTLEGKALFAATESMRESEIQKLPAVSAAQPKKEDKSTAPSESFYGKPSRARRSHEGAESGHGKPSSWRARSSPWTTRS